jgi:hypothetical protein
MDSNASYIPESPIIHPFSESNPSLTTEASYQSNSIYNDSNYKLKPNSDSSSYLIRAYFFESYYLIFEIKIVRLPLNALCKYFILFLYLFYLFKY